MPMKPHDFWQDIHPPKSFDTAGPFEDFYPATLDDERQVLLPIRPLAESENALASLIVNQASFAVLDALAEDLAKKIEAYNPDVIAGLPTLGLTLASVVAQKLGHNRYVPLGTSRKFWYDEALSVPLSSITTPGQQKRLYIDPRMLPLLDGQRVVLVDDVISSGASILAGLALLQASGIKPVAIGAAMLQTDRWREKLAGYGTDRVAFAFSTPLLQREGGGWVAA